MFISGAKQPVEYFRSWVLTFTFTDSCRDHSNLLYTIPINKLREAKAIYKQTHVNCA